MHTTSCLKTLAMLFALHSAPMAPVHGQQLDYLSKAPFYRNYQKQSVTNAQLAHLPVAMDEMVREEFFYSHRAKTLQPLIEVMNSYLDSLGRTTALTTAPLPQKGSPYVFVGSSEAETAPPGSEMMRQEHDQFPPMVIYVKKPSREWKEQLARLVSESNAQYLLATWVGFVEYPKANKGLFKKKVVLGTNYEPEIRFLSAVDEPVEVLQLNGMLLSRKGEVIRAGAEGIIHEDTPFWAQVFDIKKGVDDKAIQELISNYRREDLPGKPLAWKASLDILVDQLTSTSR